MVHTCVSLLVICSVFVLAAGSLRNLPTVSFEEGYAQIFGDDNLVIVKDGKSAHLSLDQRTGFFFLCV